MIRKGRSILLASAVLLLVLAFVHYPVKAGTHTATSRGVTLLQFTCGEDPNNGPVYGPNSGLRVSTGWCSGIGNTTGPALPSGTLYNLRAIVGAGTSDSTPATLKVTVYTSTSPIPVLLCKVTTANAFCQDLTHNASINAGDWVYANVSIPDSNTFINAVTLSAEENIEE
jgi:hypothetical protein